MMQQLVLDIQKRNSILLKLIVVLITLLVCSAIYLLSQEDPLLIEYDPDVGNESSCTNGSFVITRLVTTDTPLNVSVRETYIPINNLNTQYTAGSINYPLDVSNNLRVVFQKTVPDFIPNGEYLYMPEAYYSINPIKTIVKKLPYEKVTVNCKR